MTAALTPFQQATVLAAVDALTDAHGPRRFLIADETGLGKTVVARGVIDHMRQLKSPSSRPFRVYYITSGQRIAHQNRSRLLEFLPEDDLYRALIKADRLSLVPMERRERVDVELFALTPYTSFPDDKKRQGSGRKDERAFMALLLNRITPRVSRRLPKKLMQGQVGDKVWAAQLLAARIPAAAISPKFKFRLRATLTDTFGSPLAETLPASALTMKRPAFIAKLRQCLSLAVLQAFPPDIVILDEFQKFRDFLTARDHDALVKCMFSGIEGKLPAILLLSATPFRTYATRWEEEDDAAQVQLYELVEFLAGEQAGMRVRDNAETLFREFGHFLRQIPRLEADREQQKAMFIEAREVKLKLEALLTKLMSRTERALIANMDANNEALADSAIELTSKLTPGDIASYRHLVDGFDKVDRSDAVPYWLSVPLAAQALGPRYKAWDRGQFSAERGVAKITKSFLARPQAATDWAHPKLRALKEVTPASSLVTPWVRPSLEWWPLQGQWADSTASPKLLLFGRFRAAPQSIAALTSLATEAHALGRGDDTSKTRKRRRFRGRDAQMPIFALFHPSPFLVERVDPLMASGAGLESVRRAVRQQLSNALKAILPIRRKTKKERTRNRPTWIVLANIERQSAMGMTAIAAWRKIPEVHSMLEQWQAAPRLDWISPRELHNVADLAISSPAIVCARALRRHQDSPFTPRELEKLIHLSWYGLRTYLDEPVFHGGTSRKESSAEAMQRMVRDGGLESVFDEHFWMKTRSGSQSASALMDDLYASLKLNAGAFTFRALPDVKQGLRVRCHAAVPFGGTDDESYREHRNRTGNAGVPARADEIREAFNTPFWPHIVATTSVGQEGLDFHTWCDRVAHWDLCPSPVELEQREGRIHRFAGLVVRKKLASELGQQVLHDAQPLVSPWGRLERLATDRFPSDSGISPWWQMPGATIHRYFFRLPMSRDIDRLKALREQRLIYRLALGQPNSEDLIASLANSSDYTRGLLHSLVLNLCAYAPTHSAPAHVATGAS